MDSVKLWLILLIVRYFRYNIWTEEEEINSVKKLKLLNNLGRL